MANTSEKKRTKQAGEIYALYRNIIIGLTIYYLIFNFALNWSLVTWKSALVFAFFTGLSMFCFNTIVDATQRGLPYEVYQDVLFINWFVQAVSVWTWYAWLVYLSIPGYAIYKYGGILKSILGFGRSSNSEEEFQESDQDKKRREKKERKAEREQKRGVVKYVR